MNDLCRDLAPMSARAWKAIDDEAREVLKGRLAARRLVDFSGPHGWDASSVALGRATAADKTPFDGVAAAVRQVQPLVELRVDFTVARSEIAAAERGAQAIALDGVREAAEAVALAEDKIVFEGWSDLGIVGVCAGSPHDAVTISDDWNRFPDALVEAMALLADEAVGGPYALALGPTAWKGVMTAMDPAGYPVVKRVRQILEGPIVRAPSLSGAALVSTRGGDFELFVGRDLSVGYSSHDADNVSLYLIESLTFRNLTAEAAVSLVPA